MKRIYLVRHAKSSWKNPDLADFDRPLNSRGKHDAPLMGKQLTKKKVKPDIIICSPAKRALRTATIIANEIDFPKNKIVVKDSLYGASVSTILNIIQYLDDSVNDVMLVGHNPEFTSMANRLSDYQVENMPTCSVFCVDFEIQSWQDVKKGDGIFKFFDYPKKHG